PAAGEPVAYDPVDVLRRRDAVVDQPDALAQERELQPVPDEAGYVAANEHGLLSERPQRLGHGREHPRVGALAGDDLDRRHQERRGGGVGAGDPPRGAGRPPPGGGRGRGGGWGGDGPGGGRRAPPPGGRPPRRGPRGPRAPA